MRWVPLYKFIATLLRGKAVVLEGVFLLCVLLCSCTKEVAVSLKSITPKLVIEGVVSNQQDGSYVRLSYSQDFSNQQAFTYLADGLVVLTDSSRQVFDTLRSRLDENGYPYFPSRKIRPLPGHVYLLNVVVNGQSYSARSVMPDTVTFEGISLLSEAGKLDSKSVFTAVPQYVDPPGVRNFYRFEQYINHKKDPGINVLNDNVGDGLPNERPIFTKDIDIHLGDTLTVAMIQISEPVYQYFYQLQNNQQTLGATPSNPTTNITTTSSRAETGVLGYFSAEFCQYFTARITDE
ncbi:hypothetical protein GCM10027566_38410 [Arachidicoccus ginsenosidivorans]|uniref:DUF4249 domain-containing protein n=1 Tax=Arachidicoccus ginsenosidivorans TaxID=496057 RepID=A0A5B8VSV8_9BACT|nr:DUF4249 family protein [Arachidicoccus ginsenosidivorans]QEC73238.1 DUF4249 domain-containing protein [Arachidicoccus ginsenosidivorans]